jgi:hypothetical protein
MISAAFKKLPAVWAQVRETAGRNAAEVLSKTQ